MDENIILFLAFRYVVYELILVNASGVVKLTVYLLVSFVMSF